MKKSYNLKNLFVISVVLLFLGVGVFFSFKINSITNNVTAEDLRLDDQEATVRAINKTIPAVVSIIVFDYLEYENIDIINQTSKTERVRGQVGQGTGFLITSDGLIITNKHVVESAGEKTGEYRIILNTGKQYYAQLIGKDPINDLAVLKIFDKNLPFVGLGDSDKLSLGTTVLAIGNSVGQYQNSVTKGIISGLNRNIVASDSNGDYSEDLNNVLQTDAEINLGNSGGPLIDLYGRVVGINVAVDQTGSAIGFAIPINDARPVINSVKEKGRIIRARIGLRYAMITPELAIEKKLTRQTGALVVFGENGEEAIVKDSPADKAGIQANDIVTEINSVKLEGKNTLISVVQKYKPGDKIILKILRGDKILTINVLLDEFK